MNVKHIKTLPHPEGQLEIKQMDPPLSPELAWEIEAFLLKIFEFGDYSFRSALLGEYSSTLGSPFFLAFLDGKMAAAAACLFSRQYPLLALMGPVATAENYRRKSLASSLINSIMEHLSALGCRAVYLGVSHNNHPARTLYRQLGFENHQGIIMRRLLPGNENFDHFYFAPSAKAKIRKISWGDYGAVLTLLACPCDLYCFDFFQGLFSSKYAPPTRFMNVFPEMMKRIASSPGGANVLLAEPQEKLMGIAHLTTFPGTPRSHIALLDFFVHDNYITDAKALLLRTLRDAANLNVKSIYGYVPARDELKQKAFLSVGARPRATLPKNISINGQYQDVLVYEMVPLPAL
ncbi:GNAT family N-acetyltransferase [Planctomycetota bacterium]